MGIQLGKYQRFPRTTVYSIARTGVETKPRGEEKKEKITNVLVEYIEQQIEYTTTHTLLELIIIVRSNFSLLFYQLIINEKLKF